MNSGTWHRFGLALSFLTILRLPFASRGSFEAADLAGSFSFFPIVGCILGLCAFLAARLFGMFMPPALLAVWVTVFMVLLTRGLHLDGLADLADGVGGGYTPERRLQIMKDSRSGAFGVLALVLAVAIKVSSLHAVFLANQWYPLLLVPALSRFSMVMTAYGMHYARPEGGLGKPYLENCTSRVLYSTAALAFGLALLLSPFFFWLYLGLATGVGLLFRRLARRWLGGVTGDVLGATNEVAEVVLFSAAACLIR